MTPAEYVRSERLVATQVDALFDCGQPTPLGPCVFPAGHDDQHTGLLDPPKLCTLCRGRLLIPGTTHACTGCPGNGLEP